MRTQHKYFLAFDTEDDSEGNITNGHLFGDYKRSGKVHFIDRKFKTLEEIIEMCTIMSDQRITSTYLVGFGIAYDLNNILKYWAPDRLEAKGKFITTLSEGIKALELSMNWFQGTNLKKLSRKFFKDQDTYIDIHHYKNPRIDDACRSHAEAAYKIIMDVQKRLAEIDMQVYLTASSTAMHYFNKHCKYDLRERDLNGYFDTSDALKYFEDLAYRGGRTEAFKLGRSYGAYYYDVVSMYPSVMRTEVFPHTGKLIREVEEGEELDLTKEGFASVTVFIPNMLIPPLLIQREGKLLAPVGTVTDSFVYPELRYLLQIGGKILKVEYGYEFESISDLFTEYIEMCWELKQNPDTKELGKLLMNGLSGKFGQKLYEGGSYVQIINTDGDRNPDFDIEDNYYIDGIEYGYEEPTGVYSFPWTAHPLLSAYICACARIKLHKAMAVVGFENVIYCDTDSIMCLKPLPVEYIGSGLGQWELKAKGQVDILAPKKYRFKSEGACMWELKANGIPRRIVGEFFADPTGVHYTLAPIKFHTAIRLGKTLNKWVLTRKHWLGVNNKRTFDSKGSSVPIRLDEEVL